MVGMICMAAVFLVDAVPAFSLGTIHVHFVLAEAVGLFRPALSIL